eukprot:Skav228453  [mRNA]  locus=scaffold1058:169478:172191:+ [translate_table: standard]
MKWQVRAEISDIKNHKIWQYTDPPTQNCCPRPKKLYSSRVSSLKMVPPVFCSILTPVLANGSQKHAKTLATRPAAIKMLIANVQVFGMLPSEREDGVPYQQIVAKGSLLVGDKSADSQLFRSSNRPNVAA